MTDITYVGSQSWPFPHQLMIGFTVRYAGGRLRLNSREIADATWFSPDRLGLAWSSEPGSTTYQWLPAAIGAEKAIERNDQKEM